MSRIVLIIFLSMIQIYFYATSPAAMFKSAAPGYHYSFPKDHGSHEAYRTEWWYYTGHLQTTEGRAFGYQLTFFRSAMDHPSLTLNPSRWAIRHLYLAHFAVTDEKEKRFFYTEKVNRVGIGNAGAIPDTCINGQASGSAQAMLQALPEHGGRGAYEDLPEANRIGPTSNSGPGCVGHLPADRQVGGPFSLFPHGPPHIIIWNGGWKVIGVPSNSSQEEMIHHLTASEGEWAIDLMLTPLKPPVIHGLNGISKKGEGFAQASHYYSLTQIETRGTLKVKGLTLEVKGTSWMDHEFGSNQLSDNQVGWDWFGLQLDNGIELMLYHIRQKDGIIDPFSSGTLIWPDGSSKHLTLSDFQITSSGLWQSPKSGGKYPNAWQISMPGEGFTLSLMPSVSDQELITAKSTGVTYWEGSVNVQGTRKGQAVSGKGYVELTGHAESMRKKF